MCSAFKNKGIQSLLDSVIAFLPSPVDKGSVIGVYPRNDEKLFVSRMMKAP